ncbi:bifunctional metallophosphatase/5'-nucleotidase [Falsibacillus albus]|nr:5'-nucleotidase C-terminal domain-containing protein [Falsibacillus albus]
MNFRKMLIGVIATLSFSMLSTVEWEVAQSKEATNQLDLTLLYTNDTHSHLENIPFLHSAIKQVRQESKHTLLFDAGDVFSGTLFFNQFLGQADLALMNRIGYDAMTFGNHEFDRTSAVLSQFVSRAKFPFVSANIDFSHDPDLSGLYINKIGNPAKDGMIYPAIIKQIDGHRIGIIGVTTEETPFLSSPGKTIIFQNAKEKMEKMIQQLRKNGINKIVVLSHLGFNEDKKLAKEVAGIDVIIGGHSHTKLDQPVVIMNGTTPTIIVQANEYAKYLGELNVVFDPNGKLDKWNGKLIDVHAKDKNGNDIYEPDQFAQQKVREYSKSVQALETKIIGTSAERLNGDRPDIRIRETNLGDLIADALLNEARKTDHVDIAFQNSGGIRASLEKGPISVGNLLNVLPFGDSLIVLPLTGYEIISALEHGVSALEEPSGRFLQVSGIHFEFDPTKPIGKRVTNVKVKSDDSYNPINPNRKYSVVMNKFMADGGDGYTVFKEAESQSKELPMVDYEAVSSYIQKMKTVTSPEGGRIVQLPKKE